MPKIGRRPCTIPDFKAAEAMMNIMGPEGYQRLASKLHKIIKADPDSPALSEPAGVAILHYTATGFRRLNQALRAPEGVERDLLIQSTIMCDALETFPQHEGQVYRSEMPWHGMWDFYKPYSNIVIPSFMSTTFDFVSVFDHKVKMIIDHKTGRFLNPYSVKTKEWEVLFCPGAEFYVRAVENEDGTPIIYMEEV